MNESVEPHIKGRRTHAAHRPQVEYGVFVRKLVNRISHFHVLTN